MGKIFLYPVIKLIAILMSLLPLFVRQWIGAGLGRILHRMGFRQKVVKSNIDLMYPSLVESEKSELESRAYTHLGKLFSEIPLVFSGLKRFTRNHNELLGKEHWREAKEKGNGVIFLSSHVGNWEVMASLSGKEDLGLMLVTKRLKPAWFHEKVEKNRKKVGVLGTYEPKTMRDVFKHLKKNETVGMVLDQYSGPPVGYRVPFFGQPVGTSAALAMMVKRTGAIVLPVVNFRTPKGEYRTQIEPPVEWIEAEPEFEIAVNTANYAKILERHVRKHPEQWLWTHRRFKGDLEPLKENEWKKRARR